MPCSFDPKWVILCLIQKTVSNYSTEGIAPQTFFAYDRNELIAVCPKILCIRLAQAQEIRTRQQIWSLHVLSKRIFFSIPLDGTRWRRLSAFGHPVTAYDHHRGSLVALPHEKAGCCRGFIGDALLAADQLIAE